MAEKATHPKKYDLDAFKQIVAAHEAAVRAFIAVRIEDPIEAHDLAQEVFLLLWRRLEEIDLDRPLRPWLLTVAMNLVRGHRRRSRQTPVAGHDAILALLHDQIDTDAHLDGPVFDALRICLKKLGDGSRRLIHRRYADELSIQEICEQSGRGHSSVTMKLHRLRSRLMDCIESTFQEALS